MTRNEHLLWCLAEECTEVAHRASKAARFSLGEIQPGQFLTNAERLVGEMTDLIAVWQLLIDENESHFTSKVRDRLEAVKAKKLQFEKYLAYSAECGTYQRLTSVCGEAND